MNHLRAKSTFRSMLSLFTNCVLYPCLLGLLFSPEINASCGSNDYIWNGSNTKWGTSSNWSPNGIPSSSDDNILLTSVKNLLIDDYDVGCFDVASGKLKSSSGGKTITVKGDYFRALYANTIQLTTSHQNVIKMDGNSNQTYEVVDAITNLEISTNNLVRITEPGKVRRTLTLSGTSTTVQIESQGEFFVRDLVTIPAGITVKVHSGATFYIQSGLTVNGRLDIQAGGSVKLGSAKTLTVGSTGELNLNGASGNAAVIESLAESKYIDIDMQGTMSAEYFRIEGLRQTGLHINGGTVTKLDYGEFRLGGSNADYITLESTSTMPTTLTGLSFYDDLAYGNLININADSYNSTSIELDEYTGDISGESYESDSNDKIDWLTESETTLSVLNVTTNSQPGSSLGAGSSEAVFAIFSFSLTSTDTETDITELTLTMGGDAVSSDIDYVRIYQDTNSNCEFDSGTDTQIGSDQTFSGSPGETTFTIPSGTVSTSDSSTPGCIIVTAGTSDIANDGNYISIGIESTSDITNSQGYDFSTASAPPVYGNQTIVNSGSQSQWRGTSNNTYTANGNWLGQAPSSGNGKSCLISLGANDPYVSSDPIYCTNAELASSGVLNWNSTDYTFNITGALSVESGFTFSNASSGVIAFTGSTDQNIEISQAFPGSIVVNNTGNTVNITGDSEVEGDITISAGTLLISSGTTLTVGGNLSVASGGELSIEDGATLNFSNSATLTVASGGTLTLVGSSGSNAIITSNSTSDSVEIDINGTIAAQYYLIEHLSADGLHISSSATIDSTYDLSDGSYSTPSSESTTLLTLEVPLPNTTLNNMTFSLGGQSFSSITNIDTSAIVTSTTVTIDSYSGDLAGPSYDNDPTYLLSWTGATNNIILVNQTTVSDNLTAGETFFLGSFSIAQETS